MKQLQGRRKSTSKTYPAGREGAIARAKDLFEQVSLNAVALQEQFEKAGFVA